jgi:carboxypeptidase T
MKRSHIWMIIGLASLVLTLAIVVPTGRAGEFGSNRYAPLVVRAYYQDEAMVRELATWTEPWAVVQSEGYVTLGVTPVEYDRLVAEGWRLEIDREMTLELSRPREFSPGQGGGIPGYSCYRTVEETYASAAQLAIQYPTLATWTDIGDSWEKVQSPVNGYDMMALRLTNSAIPGPKPALLVFGGIHAREYTTAETVTRFGEYLLQNYGVDADATWLLDYHEVHLILQMNPDGRKQAEAGMLWRKNTNDSDSCAVPNQYGVDLNRNFQFEWGCCGGSSPDSCSEVYRGSGAASEPEVQAAQDYAFEIFPDQRPDDLTTPAPITSTGVFVDLHSYAQEILWSWGFTSTPAPNAVGLRTLARKWGFFNGYEATQSLYPTDGSTKDFFYGEFGVPGYTIEMGTAFFQQCSYFESTVWPGNLPVLLYAAKAAGAPYITPAGPDSVGVMLSNEGPGQGELVTLSAEMNDTRYNNNTGTEPTQPIAAAEYYVDIPPWEDGAVAIPLAAVDGNFNSTVEDVSGVIDTSGLSLGQHIVFVRGQDAAGNWGAISALFLEVIDPALIPQASFSSTSPDTLGETTVFTNSSTGPDLSYAWDFGDGSPVVTEMNPSHAYGAAGVYTVTLTASNDFGSDSSSAAVVIEIDPLLVPEAGFSSTSPDDLGVTTVFTNTSTGSDLSYEWDFGDGSPVVTEMNPSHLYGAAGVYTVTLTASNGHGSDSFVATVEIIGPPPAPSYELFLPAVIDGPEGS